MTAPKRLILVTGCSRSGTTAIGSNLALASGTRYIYEPFNSQTGLASIREHFPVPGAGEFPIRLLDQSVEQIRTLNMNLKPGVLSRDEGWRRVLKKYIGSRTRLSYLLCRFDYSLKRIIWKDPLAAFSAEAAATRHHIPVVVTVRPPVAVAASFKRMGWMPRVVELEGRLKKVGLDFGDRAILRYRDKLDESPIASAILWRMVYCALLKLSQEVPSIYLVNVQDFVENPIERYRHLYNLLELPWSNRVEAGIERRHPRSSGSRRSSEHMPQRAHITRRDLRQINEYGRKLLAPEEITLIEDITGDIWPEVRSACLTWRELPAGTT